MKQTLGAHLILGGSDFKSALGAERLRGLLESMRPIELDQIVVINTGIDKAAAAVLREEQKRGAPIEVHKFKWINDFAAARNEALKYCKTDWWLWADHDDVIVGGKNLRQYIDEADEDTGGFFCMYLYAFDEYGNVITKHSRERLHKTDRNFTWYGRIHEVVYPDKALTWKPIPEEVASWEHHRDLEVRSDRNLPLLLAWIKDEPWNIRVQYYLGNQYFAEGSWKEAGTWYDRVWMNRESSPIDRYAAASYAGRAWRNADDVQRAIRADMAGISEFPQYADCYIGMVDNSIHLKKWEEGIAWGETAQQKERPGSTAFVNDLDYTWRLPNSLAVCCAGMGQTANAIILTRQALQVRQDEETLQNLAIYERRLAKENALEVLRNPVTEENRDAILEALPKELQQDKIARDIWIPPLLTRTLGTQPTITFYCGQSLEEWTPDSPDSGGIGGSETAVIEVARRLAEKGWKPIVFNDCGDGEGTYDGVVYANWERYRAYRKTDVFVAWRHPHMIEEGSAAEKNLLWMHDVHSGDNITPEIAAKYDRILGVSAWHAQYLKRLYPFLDNVDFVDNGVNLERFDVEGITRNRWRFVYASSPDRGLALLLKFWPYIKKLEPEAELHIFYGWESFLATAERKMPDLYRLHDMIMQLGKQPGVVWRGRVPQDELAKEFLAADIWAYPTSFLETFCITAVEAMAANLKIVTSHIGNIPYVVGDAGATIGGYANGIAYGRDFLDYCHGMMADVAFRAQFEGRGPTRAKLYTWERSIQKWEQLLEGKVSV